MLKSLSFDQFQVLRKIIDPIVENGIWLRGKIKELYDIYKELSITSYINNTVVKVAGSWSWFDGGQEDNQEAI